jgi:hypothetical protein
MGPRLDRPTLPDPENTGKTHLDVQCPNGYPMTKFFRQMD